MDQLVPTVTRNKIRESGLFKNWSLVYVGTYIQENELGMELLKIITVTVIPQMKKLRESTELRGGNKQYFLGQYSIVDQIKRAVAEIAIPVPNNGRIN